MGGKFRICKQAKKHIEATFNSYRISSQIIRNKLEEGDLSGLAVQKNFRNVGMEEQKPGTKTAA